MCCSYSVNIFKIEFLSLLFNTNYAVFAFVFFIIFDNFIDTSEEGLSLIKLISSLIELISFNILLLLLLSLIFNSYKHLN